MHPKFLGADFEFISLCAPGLPSRRLRDIGRAVLENAEGARSTREGKEASSRVKLAAQHVFRSFYSAPAT